MSPAGDLVNLGEAMARKAILVMLRHLGRPYCWTYANAWVDAIPELDAKGVTLTFVKSRRRREALQVSRTQPPRARDHAPSSTNLNFDLYEAAGFGKIGDFKPDNVDLAAPISPRVSGGITSATSRNSRPSAKINR